MISSYAMRFSGAALFCGLMLTGQMWARLAAADDAALADATSADPALIRSAASGPWSAAATWEGGNVPQAGARVQVRTGHAVTYDLNSDQVIRSVHVAGTLRFAPDKDTRLDVGLIKIQPGDDASENGFDCEAHLEPAAPGDQRPALEIGMPDQPIAANHTALVRLTYVDGLDKQSCPAIVNCTGRMDLHGAKLSRTWLKLGDTAASGATEVQLEQPVEGWRVGDRVIVTATGRNERPGIFSEERLIRGIDGARITLDEPLKYEHQGTGENRGEVANLSRNVIIESADPDGVRGHTMYHRDSAGGISYAEFRHLGKQGVLGRYSLHFHLVGSSMRGSSVIGASIWDSGNRWLTIHGTNYLVVRDCVGYGSVGHGFFMEDGTEVYNVLDRNLAVGAKHGKPLPRQVLPFDGNEGAGFWWSNSLNSFTRNVATENDAYGFRYEASAGSSFQVKFPVLQPDGSHKTVDIRTLPFVRFEDNEVHSTVGVYGVNLGEGVNRIGPDTQHPFIVRNLNIWDVHYGFRPQVPSLLVENMRIESAYGIYHPNFDNHVYRDVTIRKTNTEPFNRGHDDDSIQYGNLTVDGLTFVDCSSGMPLIQISDDNPTGSAESHFRNVRLVNWTGSSHRALVNRGGGPRPTPKTAKGVPVYMHDWFGPGRHAKVVSTKAPDFSADGLRYREEPLLTGDESRMAEIENVDFPALLNPIDDLPPATVITHVARLDGNRLRVSGSTCDNGTIKSVRVNGQEARGLADNFAEWEIILSDIKPGELRLEARADDTAGNAEQMPHVVTLSASR